MAKKKDPASDGSIAWSAPSAVVCNGLGMGAMVGGKTDNTILFIMDDETMQDFAKRPQTRGGVDVGLSLGKVGGAKTAGNGKSIRSYTFTNGVFAGLGFQTGTLVHQKQQNEVFYGSKVTPQQLLIDQTVHAPGDSQVPDVCKKLKMLVEGETWVPTQQDLDRSSRFLEGASNASRRFSSLELK